MKNIILILFSLLLLGCATEAKFKEAMDKSIGMSEDELIYRMGTPHSYYSTGQIKYLTYSYSKSSYITPNYSTTAQGWGNYATAQTTGYGGYYINRTCSVTFMIKNHKVIHWRSEGNDCRA